MSILTRPYAAVRRGLRTRLRAATVATSAAVHPLRIPALITSPQLTERAPADRGEVVQALADLLAQSGWQRLEISRSAGWSSTTPTIGGYCVDADGTTLEIADLLYDLATATTNGTAGIAPVAGSTARPYEVGRSVETATIR